MARCFAHWRREGGQKKASAAQKRWTFEKQSVHCSRERCPQERERRQDKQFQTHPELQGREPLREVPRMEVRFARRQSDPWTCLQAVRRSRHAHSLRDTSKRWP